MILRRVIEHFRKQEWTAIALDFVIVVIGVFVGIQVSNWNAAIQQSSLADSYLVRLRGDLSSMESYLDDMIAESSARYDLSVNLLQAAADKNGDDDALVSAAVAFFTEGWKTPRFTIVDAVYQDLTATGNLNLIDADLRQDITHYYEDLKLKKELTEINRDWSLPNDSRFIIEHDVYLWDLWLVEIAQADDPLRRRQSIVETRADLARLAAMSVYVERSLLSNYKSALDGTNAVTAAVVQKMESTP